jgi:hypothetical protein
MALITLTSAAGAPGVTTTAVAMTLLWPRPALLAECDPAGSSAVLAGYLRGDIEDAGGLVHLAVAHRHGQLHEQLWPQTVPLADDAPGRTLLPGLQDAAQLPSMASVWSPLATALGALERDGVDVLVDAGRLGTEGGPTPLLRQAELVLLVLRTTMPAVAAARARIGTLKETLQSGRGAHTLGLLLVGEGHPFNARDISKGLGAPVIARIANDPVSAGAFSVGADRGRAFDTSPLISSARGAVEAVQAAIVRGRERLVPAAGHPPSRLAVSRPEGGGHA